MKNFLSLFATAFLLSSVLFVSSCVEDDTTGPGTGGGNDDPPSVAISNVSETTVDGGTTITFTVTAAKGTNDLTSFVVTEDGVNLGTDRYSITEFTDNGITLNNPQILVGNDASNFVYTVNITVPEENPVPEDDADYVYEVFVTDGTLSDSDFITVTVEGVVIVDPTTPLDDTLFGVLLNQAGPAGTGGLVLNTGASVGSAVGDIRDMGIDTDLPSASNWRQQIGPSNSAVMRVVNTDNLPEGFSFATTSNKEEIILAWDTGNELTMEVNGLPATDIVEVGDLYVVIQDGEFYLLSIASIDPTADDNSDSYTIDIKY